MLAYIKARVGQAGGAFGYREFRLFFIAVAGSSLGNQIQRIADLWLIYELTDSTLYLGLTGLARGIPIIIFSLAGGLLADRMDRRKFVLNMQLGSMFVNLLLAGLILAGVVRVWHILSLSMLSSAFVAVSAPARTAMTPNLVSRELLVNAFAFTSTGWKLAQLVGPAVAGVMIATLGTGMTYAFNSCVYLVSAAVLLFVKYEPENTADQKAPLRSLMEGLSFIRRQSIITVLVAMDVIAVYFGSYRVLLPVIAADLGMGAEGFGLFSSAPAVGALIGASAVMLWGEVRYKGLVVGIAILAYAFCLAGLALSPWFSFSLAMVGLLGFFDSVQAIPRNALIQTVTPDALRGRVSSFTRMLSVGMPGLGEAQTGAVASLLGATSTLLLAAFVCAGSILTMLGWRRELRREDL